MVMFGFLTRLFFGPSVPAIESVSDIPKKKSEIKEYVERYPDHDHIYCFARDGKNKELPRNDSFLFLSGSTVVNECFRVLTLDRMDLFEPNDKDIFILRQKINSRRKEKSHDIISRKQMTVCELLLSFDLPCCRAARDMVEQDHYVSLQCMYAMLEKRYFLPTYCKNYESFAKSNQTLGITSFESLWKRIRKYEKRGFSAEFKVFRRPKFWLDFKEYSNADAYKSPLALERDQY
jgi:hypothetical protein